MKLQSRFFLVALGFAATTSVHAGDWVGQGEAGLIKASGNTESETANIGLNFKNEGTLYTHEFDFALYQASNNDVDSAESFSAAYTLKYALSERSYVFAGLSYLDDEFDGFTEQSSVNIGYGYKVVDKEKVAWDLGAGLGYRDTNELIRLDNGVEFEGKDLSSATGVLRSDYRHQLTPNTEFLDKFVAEIGSDNTFIENDAALVVAMNERFSLKAGLLIRHNTDPAPGAEETDTITSINLVYNFK